MDKLKLQRVNYFVIFVALFAFHFSVISWAEAPQPDSATKPAEKQGEWEEFAKEMQDWAKEFQQEFGPWAEQFGKDMQKWGQQFEKETKPWAEDLAQKMEKWAQELKQNSEPWAKDLAEDIETWSKKVEKETEPWVKQLMENMKPLLKEIKEKHKELEPHAKELSKELEKIAPHIEEKVQKILKAIKDMKFDSNFDIPPMPSIPPIPEIKPIPPIPEIEPVLPSPPSTPEGMNYSQMLDQFEGETVSEQFAASVEITEDTELFFQCAATTIRITPAESATQITVSATMTAGAKNTELAQELLEEMKIEVQEEGNQVTISTNGKNPDEEEIKNGNMAFVEMDVTVPKGIPISAKNSFGEVTVVNLESSVKCENSFGPINVTGSNGTLTLANSFGPINVFNHAGKGTVKNRFGSVMINGWTDDLNVKVNYGQAHIKGLPKDAVVNGNFSFGKVQLELPEHYGGSVEAYVNTGSIEAPKELARKKEMMNKETVKGALGDGDGAIRLNNQFGPVIIRKG